ncbi:MAG TPA: hypothetical protein VF992_11590 [Thermoplasmata archaeon]
MVTALSLASSALGLLWGERSGRNVLVKSQRFGFVPAWWRRTGPHGWLLELVLAVVVLVALFIVFLTLFHASLDDVRATTSGIMALDLCLGADILGSAFGLVVLERRSGVTVWFRNGYETRASRAVGPFPFPVYYLRPRGYQGPRTLNPPA